MKLFFLLLVFCPLLLAVNSAFSSYGVFGETEEHNKLGVTATDCATKFCGELPALDLWLSLQQTCYPVPQRGVTVSRSNGMQELQVLSVENVISQDEEEGISSFFEEHFTTQLSPTMTAAVCVLLAVVGIMAGYSAGSHTGRESNMTNGKSYFLIKI
mmetsp:Transcript_49842/g.85701  ORF Transcript_49842/g.85701 Transcript_49842/m.85701 type:complete len:157 (+) Transcript_49842:92-562(+)